MKKKIFVFKLQFLKFEKNQGNLRENSGSLADSEPKEAWHNEKKFLKRVRQDFKGFYQKFCFLFYSKKISKHSNFYLL